MFVKRQMLTQRDPHVTQHLLTRYSRSTHNQYSSDTGNWLHRHKTDCCCPVTTGLHSSACWRSTQTPGMRICTKKKLV